METNQKINTKEAFNELNNNSKYKSFLQKDLKFLLVKLPWLLVKIAFIIATLGVGLIILLILTGTSSSTSNRNKNTINQNIKDNDRYWINKYKRDTGRRPYRSFW